ncbi:PQQ-binding-like beta-propeller repeat protein [Streptomyces sp. TRM49041]|uniref:outer membrane protein assembly factor BamB family protein n=1 Tax=Streptomyces sp. TRM49041 TaxID=2603216 RepID=UPI0011EBA223|nr:PQQ-binding-like beta-propeller repeat protein [Streptomyces sp. TRM49041]
MTQPPPPPNQPPGPPNEPAGPPPQDGFGAPQDPPQGGYGTPPPPPPQGGPAYGYPQAPGTPQTPPPAQPPTAPGYGYPQAPGQAPNHGYPQAPGQYPGQAQGQAPGQAPGQQPSYGYPTAPMHQGMPPQPGMPGMPGMPGAPGGPGGKKKLSAQMQIIIAAAVAVVLIVSGGVWYASTKGDDDTPTANGGTSGSTEGGGKEETENKAPDGEGKEKASANTQAKVAFQIPAPVVTDTVTTKGSWLTEKTYVKSGVNEVVGYDAEKGTKLWTVPLPGEICGASGNFKDGKAAVLFQPAKPTKEQKYPPCTEVGAIDLTAGKMLWTKSVEGATSGDRKARWDEVTIGANTVAAGGTNGGAAWDLASGKELWRPQANTEGCYDMGYGGGEALVAARKCGDSNNKYVVIQNINPATGAPISSYKMPAGVEFASVVSSKPLVVAANVGRTATDGSGISDFFSIDEKTGKLKAKISVDADRYAGKCRSTEVENCAKLVVGNGLLYVPTEPHDGPGDDYNKVNEIVAFDLNTGKLNGQKIDSGDKTEVYPVRMDGGNLIVYKTPGYERGGQIVSVHGGSLKQTVLLKTPADRTSRDAEIGLWEREDMIYQDGRLYLADYFVSKPSTVVKETRYLALVYTTK